MKATRTAPVAKLVVVIDDDPLVLEATGGLLRSWGCCVVTAESCDEALVRLAETEAGRRPDLIVCDYQLSRGLTGVDAIERLRSAFGKWTSSMRTRPPPSPWCRRVRRGRSASGCITSWRLWWRWASHLGMFDHRTQKTNVVYAISDKPMSNEEWSKRYVTPH
jgi:CheY-like chemotaxis protein